MDTVSRGGNLLLDIGARANGTIRLIMEQRLKENGDWLKVNGERGLTENTHSIFCGGASRGSSANGPLVLGDQESPRNADVVYGYLKEVRARRASLEEATVIIEDPNIRS